jgi:hypothetical protein
VLDLEDVRTLMTTVGIAVDKLQRLMGEAVPA